MWWKFFFLNKYCFRWNWADSLCGQKHWTAIVTDPLIITVPWPLSQSCQYFFLLSDACVTSTNSRHRVWQSTTTGSNIEINTVKITISKNRLNSQLQHCDKRSVQDARDAWQNPPPVVGTALEHHKIRMLTFNNLPVTETLW